MEQHELLLHVVNCYEQLKIPYLITGSIASIAYGEPRFTNDIDIVADIKTEQIDPLKKYFPDKDFYLEKESIKKAIVFRGQFNIIHPASGLKIDVIISRQDSFDKSRFSRSKRLQISENESADFAAPEDVILKKLEYFKQGGSEKHLRDIASMLKISDELIDQNYILFWAEKLAVKDIWENLLNKI